MADTGMALLTASRLRAFRRCARLETITYVEGWRPVQEEDALAFGTLWHTGLEAWWTAHQRQAPADALGAGLAAVASKARDLFSQVKVEELLRGYDRKWSDQAYEVVGVEESFGAPLLNPETMLPSRTWRLAGKIDARATNGDGRRLIVEHKTSSQDISPSADYWAKLQMDHQLSIYTIGAEALGWTPEGCLYDVVLKPAQKPLLATPVEARKYTKEGRLYYAAQREQDETPEEYRTRVRKAIEADPDRYFQRREIPRTESQIAEFLADAWAQGRAMREAHLANRAPRNPDACHQFGTCPFWLCCSTGSAPDAYPDIYRRLDDVHPELTDQTV